MRHWTICLLLGILPCSGEDGLLNAFAALYTRFQVEPPAPVMQSIQQELAVIMRPVGLRFEWRSLSDLDGPAEAPALAVIDVKGRCDTAAMALTGHNPGVLGFTHVSDGMILAFSDIDCDAIRRFTQNRILMKGASEREKIFGRAIARVMAHELYHIFANTFKHGSYGVGKSAYLASELVSADFRFDQRSLTALRNSLAMRNLEMAVNSSNRAAPRPVPATQPGGR